MANSIKGRRKRKEIFGCHRGLYEYNVLPFGLTNGPTTFKQWMSVADHELVDFAVPYLDDITIFSPTLEEHTKHSQKVFECFKTALRKA